MDISNSLNALLVEVARSSRGLKQILLSDATGLVLAKVSKGTDATDFEGIASISTALYLGMASVELGELGFSQTIFTDGKLFLYGVTKDYVLVVITQRNSSSKKLCYQLERISIKISEQLDLLQKSKIIEQKQNEVSQKEGIISEEDLNSILNELSS